MKKIIAGSIVGCLLLSSGTFALEPMLIDAVTTSYSDLPAEPTLYGDNIQDFAVRELIKKYEIVLRNNNLESDYEYNNIHYYTSKMKAEDIIVPDEIINKAKKVYFLVEEGRDRIFFADDSMVKGSTNEVSQVKKEYNYRIVDFKKDQKEYIFNNNDIVKEFLKDEFRSVQITLMAEFSDTEKVAISNTVYLNLNTKLGILEQNSNQENKDELYFGYYDTGKLETYLEKISEKMTRNQYNTLLQRAEKRVKSSNTKNEDNMKITISSIKQESDFKKYTNTYFIYSETRNLLNILSSAIKNQIQNIRAYEAIDVIFK